MATSAYGVLELKHGEILYSIVGHSGDSFKVIESKSYSNLQFISPSDLFLEFIKTSTKSDMILEEISILYSPAEYSLEVAQNIQQELRKALGIPVGLGTNLNSSIVNEFLYGQGKNLRNILYLDIGTYIAGAVIINGQLLGIAEIGHIRIPQNPLEDPFLGACPFHSNCFDGLASKNAIIKRWGEDINELKQDHPAWELETTYIATAISSLIYVYSPELIILNGDFLNSSVYKIIREKVKNYLNGYNHIPQLMGDLENYIVAPTTRNLQIYETLFFTKKASEYATNQLAGDSTTDAPLPDVKKKKSKGT